MGNLYYVYGEYDPHCGCCNWSYNFDEHDTEEQAQIRAEQLESEEYSVTIIVGKELPLDTKLFKEIRRLRKEKKDAAFKKLKQAKKIEKEKRERSEYVRLKKKFEK